MSFNLYEPILFLHKVFVVCFGYNISYIFYYFVSYICIFLGLGGLNFFTSIPFISQFLTMFFGFAYFIDNNILVILIVLLSWIFVFWMLIIMFVPTIIIFPIPIIPFVFIIPLKYLMLEFIPPFKILTEFGTLQLFYKIVSRIFNPNFFTNFFKHFLFPSSNDIGNYLYLNTAQIFEELFQYNNNTTKDYYYNSDNIDNIDNNDTTDKMLADGRTPEMINDGIEINDNPDDNDKFNEIKNSNKFSSLMDKIDEDTQLCINMSQKFKLYNSDYMDDLTTDINNSTSPYSKCYSKAISSYLKSSIS